MAEPGAEYVVESGYRQFGQRFPAAGVAATSCDGLRDHAKHNIGEGGIRTPGTV